MKLDETISVSKDTKESIDQFSMGGQTHDQTIRNLLKFFMDTMDTDFEHKFKVKDLELKIYKLKDKIESVGMTFEEHERAVKRHKKYSKQLKELRRTKKGLWPFYVWMMNRYFASLELKKTDLYCMAKSKSEARKKLKAKLEKALTKSIVKIDYVEESLI